MRDPYSVLQIAPNASDEQLREAYRALARQFDGNPRKMDEINDAYDAVILARGGGRQSAWNGTSNAGSSYAPDFSNIRNLVSQGRFDDALTLIEGMSGTARNAEWHYLKGCAQRGRGWLEEALREFREANKMDPNNNEYKIALESLEQGQRGAYRAQRETKRSKEDGGDGCFKACCGLWCADNCCECMGGDLIPCC
jgi:curved DNA-binding protein CbpA